MLPSRTACPGQGAGGGSRPSASCSRCPDVSRSSVAAAARRSRMSGCSGTVSVRDRLRFGAGLEGRVTAIAVFDRGSAVRRQSVRAGQIGKFWGLAGARIADPIGEPARRDAGHQFPPPPSNRPSSRAIAANGSGCGQRWASWPSRTRSSTCARTTSGRRSTCRSTARSRRRSSGPYSPATSASRSRSARPPRSTSSGQLAPRARSRSLPPTTIPTRRRSGCASSQGRPVPDSSSGWTLTRGSCPCTSTRPWPASATP